MSVEPVEPLELRNYVGGQMVPAAEGRWIQNVEPATGHPWGRIPRSDASDVEQAVAAAQDAFPAWSAMPANERSLLLLAIADRIESRLEEFARFESADNGKPVDLARAVDIPRAVANFRFFAGAILHGGDDAWFTDGRTRGEAINYVNRRPLGVAGCISPWNLPLYLFTWKIAPALATGNTVVAKPSEVTPVTAYLLSEICREVGLPPGVLNVVHGYGPEVGQAIVEHPNVPAISFTGGTATGRGIAGIAAPMFKKLSLELGGKNPTIVFADADRDAALSGALRAAFANQGQICLCGSRILVERSVADEFTEALVERARGLRCGDPLEPGTKQGALVSRDHHEKVQSYLELAQQEGGAIACGGTPPAELPDRCRDGSFLEPAIVTGLAPDARVNTEEIFGPVATIIPFDDEAEALAISNGVPYGLSASIWTRDLDRAHRVAGTVQAGIVWVNCWLLRDLRTPFGGMKASGVGREGGEEALHFFTEPSNVCIRVRS